MKLLIAGSRSILNFDLTPYIPENVEVIISGGAKGLDQLAEKYAGKIDIYKVDVDTDRAVPRAYKIKSVPTLIFAPLNADRQMMHGDMTMDQLSEAIENILLNQQ